MRTETTPDEERPYLDDRLPDASPTPEVSR
jgi:hypothetical protein